MIPGREIQLGKRAAGGDPNREGWANALSTSPVRVTLAQAAKFEGGGEGFDVVV